MSRHSGESRNDGFGEKCFVGTCTLRELLAEYATFTALWSTASTPTNATTVMISTTNAVPGSAQTKVITGLTGGIPTYFVLWTQDEVNNWSVIFGTASATPVAAIRSVTITSGGVQDWGLATMKSSVLGSTGAVISNDGTVPCTYQLRGSTVTEGSRWSFKSSTPTAQDQFVIWGLFNETKPLSSDYGVEDVIDGTSRLSSGTVYTVSGATTGASVPAGENRTLWLRLDMPTATTTLAPQSMQIEITAEPP